MPSQKRRIFLPGCGEGCKGSLLASALFRDGLGWRTVLPRVVPPFGAVHIQWLINEGILKPGPLSSTSEPLWGHANLQAESSVRNASWFSVTLCPTISSSLSYVLTAIAESTSWEPNLRPGAKSYPINWGRVCGYILHKESEKWDKGK